MAVLVAPFKVVKLGLIWGFLFYFEAPVMQNNEFNEFEEIERCVKAVVLYKA